MTTHNEDSHSHQQHHATSVESSSDLKDPVCGMTVSADSPHQLEHQGQSYYFCSARCLDKFNQQPEHYTEPSQRTAPQPAAPAADTTYTCPMHPEIQQDHPGSCPKCGMALEPLLPSLEDDDNPELKDFSRRFWWTLPLTVIVTVLAMFGHQLNLFTMATQT